MVLLLPLLLGCCKAAARLACCYLVHRARAVGRVRVRLRGRGRGRVRVRL